MSNVEQAAKSKLVNLMNAVQPIIDKHIDDMQPSEIEFILKNYQKFLKIDLERDFKKSRSTRPSVSGIDDILKDFSLDK